MRFILSMLWRALRDPLPASFSEPMPYRKDPELQYIDRDLSRYQGRS